MFLFLYFQLLLQIDLPRVLMLLGLLATDNTTIGSTALHAALKTEKLSARNDSSFPMSNIQECIQRLSSYNLASSWGSSDNRSGSSCGCRGRCCGGSGLWVLKTRFTPLTNRIVNFSNLELGKRHRSIPRHQLRGHGRRWHQSGWNTRVWCLHRWWCNRSGELPCS